MDSPKCVMCNSINARVCASCGSIAYCSVTCQEQDYASHAMVCSRLQKMPPRPQPKRLENSRASYRLALFVHPSEMRISPVWVGDHLSLDEMELYLPGSAMDDLECYMLSYNAFRKRHLDRELLVYNKVTSIHDRTRKENKTLATFAGTREHRKIYGPVLVVAECKPAGAYEASFECEVDCALEDVRHLIDWSMHSDHTRESKVQWRGLNFDRMPAIIKERDANGTTRDFVGVMALGPVEQMIRKCSPHDRQVFLPARKTIYTNTISAHEFISTIVAKVAGETDSQMQFRSLIKRSITAWPLLNYVGSRIEQSMEYYILMLHQNSSLESLFYQGEFWLFQTREAFLKQGHLTKWEPSRLDQYVLLPMDYGYANKRDCFFVSHFWEIEDHPDPHGACLRLLQEDLKVLDWSYVWVDWTCAPQHPRTRLESWYFAKVLSTMPMIIRDCGFEYRYPRFEPRAWILLEIAEQCLGTESIAATDDIEPYIGHIKEMCKAKEVRPIFEKYKYRCTDPSDRDIIIGWIELLIIIADIFTHPLEVQEVLDEVDKKFVSSVTWCLPDVTITIDKSMGKVEAAGKTYKFTPVWRPRTVLSSQEDEGDAQEGSEATQRGIGSSEAQNLRKDGSKGTVHQKLAPTPTSQTSKTIQTSQKGPKVKSAAEGNPDTGEHSSGRKPRLLQKLRRVMQKVND